jgi:hypothetical protein
MDRSTSDSTAQRDNCFPEMNSDHLIIPSSCAVNAFAAASCADTAMAKLK